ALRLVPLQPEELRSGEAGHGGDPGDSWKVGHRGLKIRAFSGCAAVVPEDRRTDRRAGLIEEYGAMHLARQSKRANIAEGDGLGGAKPRERSLERRPPV